ncbi:TAP-like protein-domain-containing protein [Desarmillaria tabescens]|uniref:TAP-like protein-domain-containing protein n=1 Tax=Armillaria tabescens TaxID=1929756 RepID=A0AA39KAC6_ARMTA|nr:TAP-like protein-domain-containing protein [Desarmillaria tabescens]KAK0457507.1 TAP-like protein-domain-containing protein [Desarmillaria tabescens]
MLPLALTFCVLFCSEFLFPVVSAQSDFDWTAIEPTSNLSWVDCYSGFKCTRFQVPIDYSNEDGDKAALAVMKLSAQSETEYKGTVLINPGGPGGSGVAALAFAGSLLASVIGDQYDIVGFDPRGVGNSTPRAEFFLSKEEHYQWLASINRVTGTVNTTSDQIPHLWASAQVIAELAKERDSGILNYISTDNVARDMLRISEAAGQSKLQYWGVSYGTVLGSTFAAMFPDKVERMVLDGVLDMDGYYSGDWRNELADTEKVMQSFFDGCAAAGPDACAFYSSTAEEISNNLDSLYESLLNQPIPVVSPSFYGVVDYTVLRAAVVDTLYSPYGDSSILAEGLASLAAGNGSIIYEMQDTVYDPASVYDNSWEAGIAISCGDSLENTDSVADLYAYWDSIKYLSPFASGFILSHRISCSGWKFHREGRFTGPVTGNTSYPILFIGNTADPVTPLSAAKKTSGAFPGSVVLTQNSSGHTSFAASSTCTSAYVQAYFQNGTLPSDGTVCAIESEMFPLSSNATGNQRRSFWGRR